MMCLNGKSARGFTVWIVSWFSLVGAAGCGSGEGSSVVNTPNASQTATEAIEVPISTTGKPVKGVGKGKAEKPFDPRDLLKNKSAQ